jgi:hypothetical protein
VLALLLWALTGSAADPQAGGPADGPNWRDACRDLSLAQCAERAGQGDADAQYWLAEHYVSRHDTGGQGRRAAAEEDGLAFDWMARAANQGHGAAQHRLGSFYHHGRFVPADRDQARVWYRRAVERGDPAAAKALADLEGAAAQGRFENEILLAWLLALCIAPALSRGDRSLAGYAGRLWIWAPHFGSLVAAAWWVSGGSWGRAKHPLLAGLTDGIGPDLVGNLFILLPLFSGLIFLLTFYGRPQDRGHFWVSLSLYVPPLVAAGALGHVMARLP